MARVTVNMMTDVKPEKLTSPAAAVAGFDAPDERPTPLPASDEKSGTPARWYAHPQIVKSLPLLFRLLARHYRRHADPKTGFAPQGRHLHRRLAKLTRIFKLADTATVRLDGHCARVDMLDARSMWVFDELLELTPEARTVRALLREGDSFLDVGANHASYSLLAARIVGPGGAVEAFEPQPRL